VYADAGILAFPTLADEWGLVVNEAMAAGLPVLGSLYGQSVEELVTDGETGWTFRPDHVDEFDAALGRALATPAAELDRMRAVARGRAARLTPEFVAGRICEGIEQVTGAAAGSAAR
jgi:glycosyltransferase involved in cell wall biosynthesis